LASEIVAPVPLARHIGELAKSSVEILDHLVGRIKTVPRNEFPDLPDNREDSGGKARIVSSVLPAALGAVSAQAPESLLAVDNVAPVNFVESFDNQAFDCFRAVFLTEISCYDIVVDSFFEKLAGIGRAAGLNLLLNEPFQFRRYSQVHEALPSLTILPATMGLSKLR
jgi:hypothetical protein